MLKEKDKQYDLEERTAKFAEGIIDLCQGLPQTAITKSTISQIIRSSSSIGANYCEANGASSKKDFRNKIFICKKEAQETRYWIRILAKCLPNKKEDLRNHWKECQELTLIFGKIASKL